MKTDPIAEYAYDYIASHPAADFLEISRHCGRKFVYEVQQHANGFRKVDRALQKLRKAGRIQRVGRGWERTR